MRSIVCTLAVCALTAFGNALFATSPLPVTDPCDGISDYLTTANVELSYEAAFGESCIEISTTLAFGTDGFINELDEDGTVLATYEYSIAASGAQCLLSSTQGSCNAQVLEFNGDMSAISMTHDGETATLTASAVMGCTDSNACNYDASATVDDASCTYLTASMADITLFLDASGVASLDEDDYTNTSSCEIASLAYGTSNFGCSDVGTPVANTVTISDVQGNESTDSFTVTVVDNIDPTAIAQNVTLQLDADGNGTLATADVDNGSSDNCSVASLSLSQTAFTCDDIGDTPVPLTVTDGSGNTATTQATITVEDNLAPEVSVDDITVELDGSGSATLATSDVFDITGASAPAQANLIGQWTFEPGSETTDATGNWGDLNLNGATVTGGKLDLNAGSHVLTTSYSGSVISEKTLVAWVEIEDLGVEDGSPISLQATNVDKFDGIIYAEQQARRFMAGSSNFSRTQAFSPGFEETETGTLVCIAITYQDEAGSLRVSGYRNGQPIGSYLKGSLVSWSDADAEIIFGPRHTQPNNGTLYGSVDMLLEEARLYNRALTDEEMADLYDAVQFSDNCSLALASLSVTEFDCDDLSSAVANTLTVTDGSGNSTTASFDVTVVDNVAPTAVGQAATVQLDATGNGTLAAADVDNGSSDNCSVAS